MTRRCFDAHSHAVEEPRVTCLQLGDADADAYDDFELGEGEGEGEGEGSTRRHPVHLEQMDRATALLLSRRVFYGGD